MARDCNKKENPIKYRVLLSDEDSTQIKGALNFSVPKSFSDKYNSIHWIFPDSESEEEGLSVNHTFTESGEKRVTVVGSIITEVIIDSVPTEEVKQEEFSIIVPVDLEQYTLDELIEAEMPQGLSIVPDTKSIWIDKWQDFISRLVSPPIKPENIHNYMAYKPLENNLIAKLVVYDAFMKSAQGAMVLMMQTASGASPEYTSEYESHTNPDAGVGHGQEKMIETGPAKVEWFDVANAIDAFFKNGAGEDGTSVFDILRRQICALAARLRVRLWICPREKAPTIIPKMTHVAPSFIRRRVAIFNSHNSHHKHHK